MNPQALSLSNPTATATAITHASDQPPIKAGDGTASQFITVTVGAEEYGINILMVREIRGWAPVSKLPNLPPYVLGVMNLRGTVIPVFDLRARFGGGLTETTKRHVVVVLQVGVTIRGILVDGISDILDIPADRVQPPPAEDLKTTRDRTIKGLCNIEDRMVALLDIDVLFGLDSAKEDDPVTP